MFKPIAYFVIGIFTGITISELMKDAKPVEKIAIYNGYKVRYEYPHYYRYRYDYYYAVQPMQHSGQQYNTQNDESSGNSGGSTEQGETHTTTKEVNDRKKSWVTKY